MKFASFQKMACWISKECKRGGGEASKAKYEVKQKYFCRAPLKKLQNELFSILTSFRW